MRCLDAQGPSIDSLISILQTCKRSKNVCCASRLHAYLREHGLELHKDLGNYLVCMLAECGCLSVARQVFDKLSFRNVQSWNSLISGYFNDEALDDAISLYTKMQQASEHPNLHTFLALLKGCSWLKDGELGLRIQADIASAGFQGNIVLGNKLIHALSKCGLLEEAHKTFDNLAAQDVVSWNALLGGYVENGRDEDALHCFELFKGSGLCPTVFTFTTGLQACANICKTQEGCQIYSDIVKRGMENNLYVENALIDMFAKCALLGEAEKVFGLLAIRDVISWNALITGCVELKQAVKAFKLYADMQLEDVFPDAVTYISCLKACGSIRAIEEGQKLFANVVRMRFELNSFVASALVHMYCEWGLLIEAHEMLDKFAVSSIASWNAMMAGYVDHGDGEKALSCYEKILQEVVSPTAYTLVLGLRACAIVQDLEKSMEIYTEVAKMGLEKGHIEGRVMVDVFSKCDSIIDAERVFKCVQGSDRVSWSALISGYVEHGLGEKALGCFEQIQARCVIPDAMLFTTCLRACSIMDDIEKGCEICSKIIFYGFERDIFVGSTIIDMFSKCGLFLEAQCVFDMFPTQSSELWNALIVGFAEHELWDEALKSFEKMLLGGIVPLDAVTFICSLKACGAITCIEKGWEIYYEVVKKGLERDPLVGSALMDMFVKCGSIKESLAVLALTPVHSVDLYRTLMHTYVKHDLHGEVTVCIKGMLMTGFPIHVSECTSIFRACIYAGAHEMGWELLIEIVKKGLDREVNLSNLLLEILSRFAPPEELMEAFYKLAEQDSVSWGIMVNRFVEDENGEEALGCFEQMQLNGIFPATGTLALCLKACIYTSNIEEAWQLCSLTVKAGFEKDIIVGNGTVYMLSMLGVFIEARKWIDLFCHQNVASWTALITGYCELGFCEEVVACRGEMEEHGHSLHAPGLVCILKAYGSIGSIEEVFRLALEVTNKGLEDDVFVSGALVDTFSKCGLYMDSQYMFEKMPVQTTVAWTALIKGYAHEAVHGMVLNYFRQMLLEGVPADGHFHVCALDACAHLEDVDKGYELHCSMITKGIEKSLDVVNGLIEMYSRCGVFLEAVSVFDQLPVQDVVSWTALMTGYLEHGSNEEVLECLEQMQVNGVSPAAPTFICCLRACGSMKSLHSGRQIWAEIVKKQLEADYFVGNALIDMFGKCGVLGEAQDIFEALMIQDIVSSNSLISAYSEYGFDKEVLCIFEQMEQHGILPDLISFRVALRACCRLEKLERCRSLNDHLIKLGFEMDESVVAQIISILGKCHLFSEAWSLLLGLSGRSVCSWNALITSYTKQELGRESLDCFEKMQLLAICPDLDTYISTVKACCSIGVLAKGIKLHDDIVKRGFDEDMHVGSMLIDMYGECGGLLDAQKVFESQRMHDVASWSAMIKGYGMNHAGTMAVQCFESMQAWGVRPDATAFTCLLAACSHTSLLFDGQEYFNTVKRLGLDWTMEQYGCMIDLFARSGWVDKADRLLGSMQCPPSEQSWTALLAACKNHGEGQIGWKCFDSLVSKHSGGALSGSLIGEVL